MDPTDHNIMLMQMMKGFSNTAQEAGTQVTRGQTMINAWPLIGDAAEGDVVVLTKPLGIQLDINLNEWIHNLEVLNSHLAWIVGHIITSSNTTHIVNDFTII
ncbi:selenophosphate synthetase [Acanthamoeba castellanii str. Neff]|uniref:Selenophosphate synthetase n=1 Tax=Acanthamoeba castellanii (strain ATCC 30010 / Neff) TaxID=1257118 RepID=L8HFH6_ACACF|nr:selenophosphate synthetase [Acanthamoeba castellanii str. Neff]ELR23493.1 selenophosphate synthetase [Acanthamoeba castellanii str. Neff]